MRIVFESLRWLVTKGGQDDALRILCHLHRDPNDPQDTFARRELALIRSQIDEDERQRQLQGKWQLIKEKSYRKHLILASLVVLATQNTGVLVINNYNTLLYQSLGLSNSKALIVSAGYNTWAMVDNFIGATISDRVGRRKLLCKLTISAKWAFIGCLHM